jgi:hypothetical protein
MTAQPPLNALNVRLSALERPLRECIAAANVSVRRAGLTVIPGSHKAYDDRQKIGGSTVAPCRVNGGGTSQIANSSRIGATGRDAHVGFRSNCVVSTSAQHVRFTLRTDFLGADRLFRVVP